MDHGVPGRSLRRLGVEWWGMVPYEQGWNYQKSLLAQRLDPAASGNDRDILILLEHPPVYTLGTGSSLAFVNFDPQGDGVPLVRIERGGEVTYHCPGQLVGYPILNLRRFQPDLHWYLRQLEEVILQTLATYDLQGERIEGLTGVWLEGKKVAAIGIKVKRWWTMHGFALNVCPDLTGFKKITPCGIADRPVGSLQEFIPDVDMAGVRSQLIKAFGRVFGVTVTEWAPGTGLAGGDGPESERSGS